MAPFEPSRSPLGAFVRSNYGARARVGAPTTTLPVGVIQRLNGLVFGAPVLNTPHGMPNCNAADIADPEIADQWYQDCVANPGDQWLFTRDTVDTTVWRYDLGRTITDPADYGVPLTIGAECISFGPADSGTSSGAYKHAVIVGGGVFYSWQFYFSINGGDPPLGPKYFAATLPAADEALVTATYDIPASLVDQPFTGYDVAYLAFLSPVAPFPDIPGSGNWSVQQRQDSAGSYYVLQLSNLASVPLPATQEIISINVDGWTNAAPTVGTITINWT